MSAFCIHWMPYKTFSSGFSKLKHNKFTQTYTHTEKHAKSSFLFLTLLCVCFFCGFFWTWHSKQKLLIFFLFVYENDVRVTLTKKHFWEERKEKRKNKELLSSVTFKQTKWLHTIFHKRYTHTKTHTDKKL